MWWVVIGIFLLFLLIIAIVFAVSQSRSCATCPPPPCACSEKPAANACCDKKQTCNKKEGKTSALSVLSNGAVPELDGIVYAVSFLAPPVMVEAPCGKWKPVLSTVPGFTNQTIGFAAPKSGPYWLTYDVGLLASFAVTVVLINGQILLRSASFFLDDDRGDQILGDTGQVLSKSFAVVLKCGDVVSVLAISPVANFIPIAPSTNILTFTSTLSLTSIDAGCDTTHLCSSDADLITGATFVLGPNNAVDNVAPLLQSQTVVAPARTVLDSQQSVTAVWELVQKFQAGTLDNDGPNPITDGPLTQRTLFIHQFLHQFK